VSFIFIPSFFNRIFSWVCMAWNWARVTSFLAMPDWLVMMIRS